MKLRLVKLKKELLLYCSNGSIMAVTDEVLVNLLTKFNAPSSFRGENGIWNLTTTNMEYASGETLCYVDDNKSLVILNPNVFKNIIMSSEPQFLSVSEYSMKHNKGRAMIKRLCSEGRIEGAYKSSMGWVIPENAPYPKRKTQT